MNDYSDYTFDAWENSSFLQVFFLRGETLQNSKNILEEMSLLLSSLLNGNGDLHSVYQITSSLIAYRFTKSTVTTPSLLWRMAMDGVLF